MPRATLSRRALIAAAIGAGAAPFGGRAALAAGRGERHLLPFEGHLADVCRDLQCPAAIGDACLRALPASEASPEHLVALIRASTPPAGSAAALRRSLGEQSRRDFGSGKVVIVDGWMLSLSETRLYALGTLFANAGKASYAG